MSTKARAAEELEAALPPLKLDDSPAYRDEWSRQHPALSLLYHHDVITHLVWCVVACRYLTGGADGEVKIWKSESSHARSGPAAAEERHAGGPARPWLLPERHVMTLNGPVTGLCLAEREAGSSEVAVIASTDGTLTLCRTNTGEVVRILRGARGESIESFRIPALRTRGGSAAETVAGEGGGGKGATRRDVGPSRSYAADAVSRRLAPMSDLALVRRPVYAIHAYRDEVRDVFTGPSNGFFHGLRAVAPTYAHLAPHEETVADVLAGFGIPAATSGEATSTAVVPASSSSPSRQWYASTVALSVAPDARRGPSTEADAAPSRDLYLFLGFPEGLLQVYVLPRRWFQLHLHGETRLDPPSLRFPVLSVPAHAAAVLRIEVFAAKDLVVSVSEDGTTQLRRLTALQAPLRQLGVRVAPMSHGMSATPMGTSLTALSSSATMRFPAARSGGPSPGHSRSITCCCIDAAQQLLITGSADHTLCWWSLMAGSPASPIRVVSFRDASSNLTDTAAASPTQPPVHGGYPIDISLFHRRRNRYGPDGANGAAIGTEMALYVLVLDTEQVVRVFDALTGKLALVRAEESTAVSVSSSSGEARERHNVRLLRYDNVNGADRFLLGGLSLVPWYLTNRTESNAVNGHTEPVIFSAWCAALRCVVTADAHHVLLWRLRSSSTCESQPIEVLRAWRLSQGIRAIALCDDRRVDVDGPASACPTLLVTTIEQPQLVQYDCLAENPFQPTDTAASAEAAPLREPLALRHFALRTESGGTDTTAESVTALAAVCMSAEQQDVAYAASAQVAPTTCFAAVCQRETVPCAQEAKDGTAGAGAQSSLLLYVLRDSAPNAPATDATTSDLRLASREIHLSHRTTRMSRVAAAADVGEMVSVLPVPSRRLLVLGGRQLLYVASLFGLAAAATPCTPLTATAPPPQVGRKSTLSVSGDAARRVSALIPGRLSPAAADGEQDEESGGVLAQSSGGGAGGVAGAAAVASSTTSLEGYLSRLVFVDTEGEEGSRAAVAAAPSQPSAAPCLILSGSNVGVVQLWDAHCGAELWRCGVSMTQEPITALAVCSCAGRWLAAVGDQTGVVTLLDVTGAVVLSTSQQRQSPLLCKATTSRSSAVLATAADAFMIDRWQAHMESVTGLCFPAEEQQPASPGCQLLSTGEDTSVVAWTLPLIASSVFGCVKIGRRLFTSNTSYPLRPAGTELPWATREAYAKLRERYVRQSLFERDPELLSAFAALYAQPGSSNSGNGGGGGVGISASEESLVERAWDALTRDAASLLAATQRTPPSTAVPLNESMVREWCATLVTAAAAAAPAAPAQPALAPQRRLGARASTTSNNNCADLNSTLFSLNLLFAFADRCCSGAGVARPAAQDSRGGPSTAVRAALRSAIRAVVQATTAADTQRSLHTSPVPEPPAVGGESAAAPAGKRLDAGSCAATSNTTTTQAARPAAELFSAVATVTALSRMPPSAAVTAPPSSHHNPQHASTLSKSPPPNPPPLDVVTPAPVATEGPRINPPSPGLSPHRAAPKSHDRDARSRQEPRAVAKVGTSPPTQSLGCRVTYYTSAPLVRTAPLSLDGVLSQPGDDAGSPGPNAHATRTSAARASDVPFTDCAAELFDGGDAVDTASGDGDGGDDPRMGGSRAAVVVERVHRDRRRHGDVLQYIGVRGGHPDPHDDLLTEVVAAARADRKLTRESISRYVVVKESCRAIVEDTTQQQRDHRKAGAAHFKAGGGAATAPAAAPPVPVRPVVSVTYLAPALARANVGANSKSRDNRSSAELSWYSLRQRKRDAAEEGARLWNTPRVMRTLMGWSGTAPVDERRRNNRNAAGGAAAAPTALPVRGEQPSSLLLMRRGEGPTGTPPPSPGLVLPRILAAHAPDTSVARGGNDSGGSVDPNGHQHHRSDATAESRQAKAAAVLPALLHVPPTAAVDAAVHAGLPSRATLQAEMAAMQARMRQSVQQRAAQQRQQRIAAAASRSESALSGATTAAAAAPLPTADGGSESNGSVMPDDEDEVDTENEAEELVDDVRDPPLFSPAVSPVPAVAHDERAASKQRLLSSSSLASAYSTVSLSPRPKMSLGSQRRAGQSGELVMPRQMSTVPLPSAVTRRDLFVHRSGGGSGDGGEREYEGGKVC